MIKIEPQNVYSIYDIDGNAVLYKNGVVGLAYLLKLPEPNTLSEEKFDERVLKLNRAFSFFGDGVFLQKQDVFIRKNINSEDYYFHKDFITKGQAEFFDKKEYFEHTSLLIFSLTNVKSIDNVFTNPFKNVKKHTKQDIERIKSFEENVKNSVSILNNLTETKVLSISESELKYLIFNYCNGYRDTKETTDILFSNTTKNGDVNYKFYCFSDSSHFPSEYTNVVEDENWQNSSIQLYRGFFDDIGVYYKYNHIYNQIIYFQGHENLYEKLDERIQLYKGHEKYSKRVENQSKKLQELENEVTKNKAILCKVHYNVMVFENDETLFTKAVDSMSGILAAKNILYYSPTYENAYKLFVGSTPGRNIDLLMDSTIIPQKTNYFFLTILKNAVALFNHYGDYKEDNDGLIFQDRLYNKPIKRDIIDLKTSRIYARNGLVFAPTGSGKSSSMLNTTHQLILAGVKLVIIEFGRSFENLMRLFPDRSTHIVYDPSTPLGINPFDLEDKPMDAIKKTSLTNIIFKYWRMTRDEISKEIVVTMHKLIDDYYAYCKTDHKFENFYNHVINNYEDIKARREIPDGEKYFNVVSFKHVLSEFLPGGIYGNICAVDYENERKILKSQVVLFELSKVADDPFLISIIFFSLQDTFNNKILSNRKELGGMIFDEYAKSQEISDDLGGLEQSIHATAAQLFQTVRKELGFIWLILQAPSQLKPGIHTNNIVSNTQLLFVLQGNEKVSNDIVEMFKIKNQEHIALMKSVKNNYEVFPKYSEMFIRWGEGYATVVRQLFSPKKFYAFQTDGVDWTWLNTSYKKTKNLETSINDLIIYKDENNL